MAVIKAALKACAAKAHVGRPIAHWWTGGHEGNNELMVWAGWGKGGQNMRKAGGERGSTWDR